jgi:voltage-gated sodium channel
MSIQEVTAGTVKAEFDKKAINRQLTVSAAELKALEEKVSQTQPHHSEELARMRERTRRTVRIAKRALHTDAAGRAVRSALHKFDDLSDHLFILTTSWVFEAVILSVVSIACVAAGMNTYGSLSSGTILILESFTFGVFTLEFLLKVLSNGREPWRYYTGYNASWNCFDFLVLCGSSPFFGDARGIVSTMRALRLLKILNFLSKHLPKLGLLLAGISGGLDELASILALTIILFWIFSSFAMSWFGSNDALHWGTLGRSMATSTSLMTNDWTSKFYISYFGCTDSTNFGKIASCTESMALPASSLFYYIIFMVLGTVLLSMCIGSIAISMDSTVNYLQDERERQHYAQRRLRGRVSLYHQLKSGKFR